MVGSRCVALSRRAKCTTRRLCSSIDTLAAKSRLPPGTYFIGDPAYAFYDAKWQQICELLDQAPAPEGEFILDNCAIALYAPLYGDGCYFSSEGRNKPIPVDSSTIGCVPFSLIPEHKHHELTSCGLVITFSDSVRTGKTDTGDIFFGHVSIHTG